MGARERRRIHLGPVGGIVGCCEERKYKVKFWKHHGENYIEQIGGYSVSDHVENGAEFGRLIKVTGGHTVEEIEHSAEAIGGDEDEGGIECVVNGGQGEDDSEIPNKIGDEKKDVFLADGFFWGHDEQ